MEETLDQMLERGYIIDGHLYVLDETEEEKKILELATKPVGLSKATKIIVEEFTALGINASPLGISGLAMSLSNNGEYPIVKGIRKAFKDLSIQKHVEEANRVLVRISEHSSSAEEASIGGA
jgi:hypothetical protein